MPDERLRRQREEEESRARGDRLEAAQDQLGLETAFRRRRGIASLFGGRGGLTSLLGSG